MKPPILLLFFLLIWPFCGHAQTIQLAIKHLENLEKTAEVGTTAFLDYASDRFLNKKEKDVTRRKNRLLEVLQSQEKRIENEPAFNGQVRLKNGYSNYLTKLKQFPDHLEPYLELSITDYQTGLAQKRKKDFIDQMELLKSSAADLNMEVIKYITMNKLKDFKKGSALVDKWDNTFKIVAYSYNLQEAILTIGALDRDFWRLVDHDSLEKSESVRLSMLQQSATLGATVKIRSPVPTDFSLRDAAVSSINLYRQDAFRSYKAVLDSRKKEMAFHKKYPKGAPEPGKNKALLTKYELEQSQLDAGLSTIRSLIKEVKKDRDKHEKIFDDYLAQFVKRWTKGE